jgi:hypothetical protein
LGGRCGWFNEFDPCLPTRAATTAKCNVHIAAIGEIAITNYLAKKQKEPNAAPDLNFTFPVIGDVDCFPNIRAM